MKPRDLSYHRRSFVLILILLGALKAGSVVASAEAPPIKISLAYPDPADLSKKKALDDKEPLPVSGATADFPVWLVLPPRESEKNSDGAEILGADQKPVYPKIFIYGSLRDANGLLAGQLKVFMGTEELEKGLPGKGGEQSGMGRISITGIVPESKMPLTGSLLSEKGVVFASFTVERKLPLSLLVNGVKPPTEVKLTTKVSTSERMPAFTLSAAGGNLLKGVKVRLPPFINDRGGPSTVTWTVNELAPAGDEADLPSEGLVTIYLKTNNLPVGVHKSTLMMIHEGGPTLVPLTLERAPAPKLLELYGVSDLRVTTKERPSLLLNIQETSGAGLAVTGVELSRLVRVEKDGYSQGVLDSPSGMPRPGLVLPPAGKWVATTLKMKEQAAGKYEGTVTVTAPDAEPKSQNFTLYVKEPWWVAAGFISAGIFVVSILRWVTTKARPRLALELSVAKLTQELDNLEADLLKQMASLEPDEVQMLAYLRAGLARLRQGLDPAREADAQAAIKMFGSKLTVVVEWIRARRQVRDLPADVPGLLDFNSMVNELKAFLAEPRASEAAYEALEAKWTKLAGDIDAAMAALLSQNLKALVEQMQAVRDLDDKEFEELKILIERANTIRPGSSGSRAAFEVLRGAFAGLLAQQLERIMSGSPPLGFEGDHQARWELLKTAISKHTRAAIRHASDQPAEAMVEYRAAYATYIARVAQRLLEVVTVLEEQRKQSDYGNDEAATRNWTLFVDGIAAIRRDLQEVMPKSRDNDMAAAGAHYASAVQGYKKLPPLPLPPAPGESMEHRRHDSEPAPAVEGVMLMPSRPEMAIARREATGLPTVRELKWRLTVLHIGMGLGLGFIAVLLGLNYLWAGQPDWGGWSNYAAAFTWGLGLQAMTTFNGFKALEDALVKS